MINLKMLREQARHVGLIDEELIELLNYIDQLQQEIQEQCRVNGMGAEREVALLSRITQLEKERREMACTAMETCDLIHDGEYQKAYNYLEENFESIYNED